MKRKHGPPIYNLTTDGSSTTANAANGGITNSVFVYQVEAFDQLAAGQGKNKRAAKHEAAINLLVILRAMPEFAAELADMPQHVSMPGSTGAADSGVMDGGDAVCKLLDICVQRAWPIASFTVQQAFGTAHAPAFRVECRLASMVRVGTFSTKKGAKQLAAQEMLRVVQTMPLDEREQHLATLHEETPEKHVKTYRELRQSDIKTHTGTKLCDRHMFFQRMEAVDRAKWHDIFHNVNETPMEKVYMLCRSMGWKVKVSPVENHADVRMRLFELDGCAYDVVLAGIEPQLYADALEYFGEMSGLL